MSSITHPRVTTQAPESPDAQPHLASDATDTINMPLSKHKQDNTTLWIRLDDSDACRGKKMRSCPTISAFFACICTAWGVDPQSISLVEVVFDKVQVNDRSSDLQCS